MSAKHKFTRVTFEKFKAFDHFTLNLRHFNVLVGPNNAGKSTTLTAFRILSSALRRAGARKAEMIRGPQGVTAGYPVDLKSISVAEENIFYNYDDDSAASIKFRLSNGNELSLYFPEQGSCYLIADAQGKSIETPAAFRLNFNCPVRFVPILGPVDHNENLYEKEAARLALFNYRAARNFRNIWYHYPEKFESFREHLAQTWPGMDIERPTVNLFQGKPRLHMFCIEDRIPREIFWSGFGFQIWCQMLTHLIQASEASLFLIDEPDIYLHSDLQRQLLGLLRSLGPDILIATHSTEIITEAEAEDIVLISKRRRTAQRSQSATQLANVFSSLGSSLNPVLTQLAKTRKAVFVEGKDFQVLSKFARKLGANGVANRSEFAVIPVEGFSPDRIRSLKRGIELTLGFDVAAVAILERDYRSDPERAAILRECQAFCRDVTLFSRKELENFLLVAPAIDRAVSRKIADQAKRSGTTVRSSDKVLRTVNANILLDAFCQEKKSYVTAQYLTERRRFERATTSGLNEATLSQAALQEFEVAWTASSVGMIPGKEALSYLNQKIQEAYGVSLTSTAIIDAMSIEEVPDEMVSLIRRLGVFARGT